MSMHSSKEDAERQTGRTFTDQKVFSSDKTFSAYHQAEKFCRERGYSVGRMCGDDPTGIKIGSYDIQKWRNLSFSDRKLMEGALIGEFRDGPVTVLFNEEDVEAHKAELADKAARTYRVFYSVTFDGYVDVEADSPAEARKEVLQDAEDQDLVYGAEREDLTINDVQNPETGDSYPVED